MKTDVSYLDPASSTVKITWTIFVNALKDQAAVDAEVADLEARGKRLGYIVAFKHPVA